MSGVRSEAANFRYLLPGAADFLAPVGRAINKDLRGDEAAVVRGLADAGNVYDGIDGGGGR